MDFLLNWLMEGKFSMQRVWEWLDFGVVIVHRIVARYILGLDTELGGFQ